jgi:hypothetical protein
LGAALGQSGELLMRAFISRSALFLRQALSLMLGGLLLAGMAQAEPEEDILPIDQGGAIYVAAAVLDVDAINSVDQSFTINFYVQFRWRDTRLAHEGPGSLRTKLSDINAPRFLLLNRQRTWSTLLDVADITPAGEVMYRMRVWGDFSQPLRLQNFPFDSHTFEIPIVALPSDSESERPPLLSDPKWPSKLAQTFSVADWVIDNWRVENNLGDIGYDQGNQQFVFKFDAERIYTHYLVKFVVPLLLIVMMSWVVFWIDPAESGSQLSVAVTVVLTLIAYHIALTNKLPDIPYLTRMDLFLFGSTLLVFGSLIEVVITSRYASHQRLELARRIDSFCRVLFPLLYLLVANWSLNVG